ncbi:hypothetical protein E5288_WYG015083 [Bos mutus]|uniref:Uncharacterized protein n=1 Tax=Bos mutus TaxID=72004 RepID=A0A6B0RGK7_9CETA|nr:hypothetical protein [Bos mutus]
MEKIYEKHLSVLPREKPQIMKIRHLSSYCFPDAFEFYTQNQATFTKLHSQWVKSSIFFLLVHASPALLYSCDFAMEAKDEEGHPVLHNTKSVLSSSR